MNRPRQRPQDGRYQVEAHTPLPPIPTREGETYVTAPADCGRGYEKRDNMMKTLSMIMVLLFISSCAGSVETSDPWQGMKPAEYVDQMWVEPDKEIPTSLTRSQEKALMDFFQMIAPLAWRLF